MSQPPQDKAGNSIRKCVENGLLKTLVKLLDSHVTIQAQAISILEEVFSHSKGERSEVVSCFNLVLIRILLIFIEI